MFLLTWLSRRAFKKAVKMDEKVGRKFKREMKNEMRKVDKKSRFSTFINGSLKTYKVSCSFFFFTNGSKKYLFLSSSYTHKGARCKVEYF